METIGIIISILFTILSFIIGIGMILIGFKNKSTKTVIISFLFFIPIFYYSYQLNIDYLLTKPTESELIGRYQESSWDWFLDKPILTLKPNGEFSFDKPFLNLCLKGEYSYSINSNHNELSFSCGKGFRVVQLNNNLFGHELIFITNSEGEGISFEKIE